MIATFIILVLLALNLGFNIINHDKPKDGKYSFYNAFISTIILLILYYYSGMFDKFFN